MAIENFTYIWSLLLKTLDRSATKRDVHSHVQRMESDYINNIADLATKYDLTCEHYMFKETNVEDFNFPCIFFTHENLTPCLIVEYNHINKLFSIINGDSKIRQEHTYDYLQEIIENNIVYTFKRNELVNFEADKSERDHAKHFFFNNKNWLWKIISNNRHHYFRAGILSVMSNIIALLTPLFVMQIYDRVIPYDAESTLWVLFSWMVGFFIFDYFFNMLKNYYVTKAGKKANIKLSTDIFEKAFSINLSKVKFPSTFITQQLQNVESISDFCSTITLSAFVDIPFTLIFLLLILVLGGWITMVPLVMIIIICLVSRSMYQVLLNLNSDQISITSAKHNFFDQCVLNIENLKTMAAPTKISRKWTEILQFSWNAHEQILEILHKATKISMLCQSITYIATMLVGFYIIREGGISQGALFACVMLVSRAIAPLGQIITMGVRLNQVKISYDSVEHYMSAPDEENVTSIAWARDPIEGEIQFNNVKFSYPQTQILSVDGVNFHIKKGERIGFVGKIGCGKSTILKMLTGLYEPTEGKILFDNHESHQWPLAERRLDIGYVPQIPFVMDATLYENLTLGQEDFAPDKVVEIVKNMGIDEIFKHRPEGLNYKINESTGDLSMGQKQCIHLARMLLRESSIYACDEPFAMMDNVTARRSLQCLFNYTKGKTLIIATHQLELLRFVDRILVFHEGKLVSEKTPAQIFNTGTPEAPPGKPPTNPAGSS